MEQMSSKGCTKSGKDRKELRGISFDMVAAANAKERGDLKLSALGGARRVCLFAEHIRKLEYDNVRRIDNWKFVLVL